MSAINELAANPPSDDFFKEKDIESLKQTIRDAQDPSTSGLNYLGKSVFDVDAMAPLNKTSLVGYFSSTKFAIILTVSRQ